MTKKTGSYKKYSVFFDMLMCGFRKKSTACVINILFTEDLAEINYNIISTSKTRYIVLSYNVEFDKIKYTLPLE